MNIRVATAAVIGLTVIGGFVAALRAQERTVWDGIYTEEQAKRGAVIFDVECAGCHGPEGEGGGLAPATFGSTFSANYDGQTVGALFDRNAKTMPTGAEGTLTPQQYADTLAFILQKNGFPAGPNELPSQAMPLMMIKYVAMKP
jgi:mono/diheme cytochrome c family protein